MKLPYLIIFVLSSCAVQNKPVEISAKNQKVSAAHAGDSDIDPKIQANRKLSEFNGDTLKFVENSIIAKKAQYIGKPLEVLLKDYHIQIKRFTWANSAINKDDNMSITLKIYDVDGADNKIANNRDPVELVIVWKTPLHEPDVAELSRRNKGWTTELQDFFGRQIVGDVALVDFKLKK